MKPMKIVRFNGSMRYKRQRRKRILKTVLVIVIAAALIGTGAYAAVRLLSGNPSVQPQPVQETEPPFIGQPLSSGETARLELSVGELCMFTLPSDVDICEVEFSSDNGDIIRVDSAGRADALGEGTASVTAYSEDFEAVCEITVSEAEPEAEIKERTTAYTANADIAAKNSENGTDDLYSITVNRRTNTVTVYTYDEHGDYTVPVRAMVASCGKGGADITPTGEYAIYFRSAWHALYGDVYGMYVSGFYGSYLFHSVPYYSENHDDLETEEFNKLGSNASQGCVRMMASDVRWIYKNCPMHTPVKVIDADSSADPLGKPPAVKIDVKVGWDPTDPNKKNPYKGKLPQIDGADDVSLSVGDSFDPKAGITAKDICGNDITDRLVIEGRVIADKPGTYYLTCSVKDDFRLEAKVTRTVTVAQPESDKK